MHKKSFTALVSLLTILLLAGVCDAIDLGIITGKEQGTYYQFGEDLRTLGDKNGFELRVEPSNGSIENIYAVYKRPGIALGIVQSDVLAFVSRVQSNPVLKGVARKIKMVYPLYNEEIHILASGGVVDFDDLAGKRVAVGEEGSGSYLTARLLFEVSRIQPKEMVHIGTGTALQQLKEGKIDAMFYVSGFPVKLFQDGVTPSDRLHLAPITNPKIFQYYPKTEIPAGGYAWQSTAVPTAAVKAVLITYDFKGEQCGNIGHFARLLADNLEWLAQNGHPKWKSVDLTYRLKGWEQSQCVTKMAPPAARKPAPAQPNPVMDAIKQILE